MPRQGWQDELAKEGDDSAQTPGRPFFGYFLVAVDKKVTRHPGGAALSISGSNSPRASAYAEVSEQEERPRTMRFATLSTSLYLIAVPETRRVQDEVDKLSTS